MSTVARRAMAATRIRLVGLLGCGLLIAAAAGAQSLTVGSHILNAVYSGDPNFLASTSGNIVQTVNYATSTTMISSQGTAVSGQSVSFTAFGHFERRNTCRKCQFLRRRDTARISDAQRCRASGPYHLSAECRKSFDLGSVRRGNKLRSQQFYVRHGDGESGLDVHPARILHEPVRAGPDGDLGRDQRRARQRDTFRLPPARVIASGVEGIDGHAATR